MIAIGPIASVLMVLASIAPTVEQLDEARFRVRIVYDGSSPTDHANAQIALMRKASEICRGKGRALSEGTLELNNAEPIRKNRPALELAEIYTCVAR